MSIENEPRNAIQAPSGAAWGLVYGLAITMFTETNPMPLLTELVPSADGHCYKHGAPNGAFSKPVLPIAPRTAKNLPLHIALEMSSL
jgi:hypothetical protein